MYTMNPDYYPTPIELCKKMFGKLKLDNKKYSYTRILEPSAGSGELIEGFKQCWIEYQEERYKDLGLTRHKDFKPDEYFKFECIEIDPILCEVLRTKGYNVIHNDFLTYEGRYSPIIFANFPFSNGVEHLLHAIKLQERVGGQIVCLVNAETIRNQYSNNRKVLSQLLDKYNADIEYIENGFTDAIRQTNVEVALIYIDVPMQDKMSMFEKEFTKENPDISFESMKAIALKKSKIEQLVFECDLIKKSVSNLFLEKLKIDDLLNGMGLSSSIKICEDLCKNYTELDCNTYFENIDLKYWNKLIDETDLKNRLPSKLRSTFTCNMEKQRDIPFNIENAYYFYQELGKAIKLNYNEIVAKVFDDLTYKYSYSDNMYNKTIHYYNGWKSNNAFCISPKGKVIIPSNAYWSYYRLPDVLLDLNIIFENISGEKDDLYDDRKIANRINNYEKGIETKNFILDSFKKQTIHIRFKNEEHLKIFNLMAGKGKGFLPEDLDSKPYETMNDMEKEWVKELGFEPEEFNKCLNLNAINSKLLMEG